MKGGPQGGQETGVLRNHRNEVGSKNAEWNVAGRAGGGQESERL